MCNRIQLIISLITLQLLAFRVESTLAASFCKDIHSNSKELQLKTHLFCDYDGDVRPHNTNGNATRLWFTILPKAFEFDDTSGTLTLHSWTALNWSDPFLQWTPNSFSDIESLEVSSEEIWVPDIKVLNPSDASAAQEAVPKTLCHVTYKGGVMCIPPVSYTSHCDADYTNYPYDVQKCLIKMGSWSYHTEELDLDPIPGIHMAGYTRNKEWQIVDSDDSVELIPFKMNANYQSRIYNIQITFQRRAEGIHIIYVAPAIVLMVLTLTVLWLDCHSTERMIVACISFVCHLLCIKDLYYVLPHNGASLPYILQFYESSFLLMGFSLILTVLLRDLSKTSTTAPQWLTAITSLLLQSKVGQLLLLNILDPKASAFLEDEAEDRNDLVRARSNVQGKRDSTWDYVILLLGWIAFVAVFLSYLVMLALYVPSNYDYKDKF